MKYAIHEGVDRREAGEARRNGNLRSLLKHAKEFGLHLARYGSPLKRMAGWVQLGEVRKVVYPSSNFKFLTLMSSRMLQARVEAGSPGVRMLP